MNRAFLAVFSDGPRYSPRGLFEQSCAAEICILWTPEKDIMTPIPFAYVMASRWLEAFAAQSYTDMYHMVSGMIGMGNRRDSVRSWWFLFSFTPIYDISRESSLEKMEVD